MDPPLGLDGVILKPQKPLRDVKAGPARHQPAGTARNDGGGHVQPHSSDAARLPCEAAEADDASLRLHRSTGQGRAGLVGARNRVGWTPGLVNRIRVAANRFPSSGCSSAYLTRLHLASQETRCSRPIWPEPCRSQNRIAFWQYRPLHSC